MSGIQLLCTFAGALIALADRIRHICDEIALMGDERPGVGGGRSRGRRCAETTVDCEVATHLPYAQLKLYGSQINLRCTTLAHVCCRSQWPICPVLVTLFIDLFAENKLQIIVIVPNAGILEKKQVLTAPLYNER